MSEVRLNFIDWRPDLEDETHDGLTEAENVIHEPEGYKPLHLASTGAFSTSGGMASVTSVVAKPIGATEDLLCAWVSNNGTIQVGVNGYTSTTSSTGYPLSGSTTPTLANISFFGVTEYADNVYFTIEAWEATSSPATLISYAFSGYITRT